MTTTPSAPEAGSNGEREVLTRIVERAAARRGHGLVVGQCECIVDDLILAGFTRAHHDETMSPTINRVAPGGSRPWTDTEQVRLAAQAMRDADFSTDEFDVYQAINVLAVQRDAAIARAEAAVAKLAEAEKAPTWVMLCRLRDERNASDKRAAALASALRKEIERCPCCRGKGVWETNCPYCGDSTFDHECVTETKICDRCAPARAALAGNGNGTGEGAKPCAFCDGTGIEHVPRYGDIDIHECRAGCKPPLPAAPPSAGETHDAR